MVIAGAIAAKRQLDVSQCLVRKTASVQRGANRKARIAQAREAFRVEQRLKRNVPYLLIDDVITTGATLRSAAQVLRKAGARTVWAAAIVRQPLD